MSCQQSTSGSSGGGVRVRSPPPNPRGEAKEEGMTTDSISESDDDNMVDVSRAAEETSILTLEWLKKALDSAGKDLFKLSKLPETRGHRGGAWATRCRGIGILLQGTALGTLMELENVRNLHTKAGWRMSSLERKNLDLENQVEFLISRLRRTRLQVKELEGKVEALKKQLPSSGEADQEGSNNGCAAKDGVRIRVSADVAKDESEEESEDEPDEGPPPRSALAKRKSARLPDAHRNGKKSVTWDASVKDSSSSVNDEDNSSRLFEVSREPETMPEMVVEESEGDIEPRGSLEASSPKKTQPPGCEPGPQGGEDDDDDVIFLGEVEVGTAAAAASVDAGKDQEVPCSSTSVSDGVSDGNADAEEGANNCQGGNGSGNVGEVPGSSDDISNGNSVAVLAVAEGDNRPEASAPGIDGELEDGSDPPPPSPPKCTYELRRKRKVSYNLLNRGPVDPSSPSKSKMKKTKVREGGSKSFGSSTRKKGGRNKQVQPIRRHEGKDSTRKYKCQMCPKSFKGKRDLTKHMYVHATVRKFPCTLCDVSFKHRRNLTAHLQRHGDETPYQCKQCEKAFKTACNLAHHARTHSGKKVS